MSKNDNLGRKFAIGAVIAGVAGYVTGILTAPQSGKDTRDDIANKAGDMKASAEEQLQSLSDELKGLLREAKSRSFALSSQAREEFNEAIVKAKDAQNKATTVLKAVKAGKADDPQLNKAIKQAKLAQKNLNKFLRG